MQIWSSIFVPAWSSTSVHAVSSQEYQSHSVSTSGGLSAGPRDAGTEQYSRIPRTSRRKLLMAVVDNPGGVKSEIGNEQLTNNSHIWIRPYDEQIYDLSYTTFLQNNNIKDAYAVASSAVAQNPNNKRWRERLAQVAIWSNDPAMALKQYLYLGKYLNDRQARINGIKLAKEMQDDHILVDLLLQDIDNGHQTSTNWNDYVNAMLRLGELKLLLKQLNRYQDQFTKAKYLQFRSRIDDISDNPLVELHHLDQLSKYIGMLPWLGKKMAVIYLGQGNITLANKVMNRSRRRAAEDDVEFWDAYAKVSYLAKDYKNELDAYQILVKQKKPDIAIYTRLVELTKNNQPKQAYDYSMQGRRLYPNNFPLTIDAYSLLANNNQSLAFADLFASTPKSLKKQLQFDSSFWNAEADYWRAMGLPDRVINAYLSGIHYASLDNYLKANLIFYLIEQDDQMHLKQVLPWWQMSLISQPNLWGAYAQAYASLNDPVMSKLIFSLFYEQFTCYQTNPYWLITFKSLLENSFFPKESLAISHYAWPVLLHVLAKQKEPVNEEQLLNYVMLSLIEAPGDPTAIALSMLQSSKHKDVELLLLTWALRQHNYPLANGVYWYYQSVGILPPLWASLSIALHRHDKPFIKKLISSKQKIVSYRDQIKGAEEIGAIPMAQTLAYRSLVKNRHDHDLYDNFFTPLMFKTANNGMVSQEYYQYGSVEGPRTNVSVTYFLMPGLSIKPYNSLWFTNNKANSATIPLSSSNLTTNQALATTPPLDERVGLSISKAQKRGDLVFDLGYHKELNSFFTAKISDGYKVRNNLLVSATLGYRQPADDTVGLLIGGMKNDLILGFNYRVLTNDTIVSNMSNSIYYTQDGQYLSDGGQLTIRYEHQLWKTYPDWTIAPYGVITRYYHKTARLLHGNILKLVPANIEPTVNFLIPANFVEYGATLSFGQQMISDYTHRWRPLASLTLSNSTSVGPGQLFNLGIAGTVIGRDHLLVYYEWGSNQGQGLQTERLIKMSYQIVI